MKRVFIALLLSVAFFSCTQGYPQPNKSATVALKTFEGVDTINITFYKSLSINRNFELIDTRDDGYENEVKAKNIIRYSFVGPIRDLNTK